MHHIFAIAILLLLYSVSAAGTEPNGIDVRVLIDVSGSMKKNDPKNLRTPALRLLTSLLPEKSTAGVWIFAERTDSLVPLRQISRRWKKRALDDAGLIHSRGQYTHIEDALDSSTKDWQDPDKETRRYLILLSDGMVDISDNPSQNTASRQRILDNVLPRLQQSGAAIHSVALSDNADHNLLQTLSMATNGWYEKIENADDLNRTFLKLFEQSTKQPTLPLRNNQFTVDDTIKDMSLLIFHNDENDKISIITPNGQAYQKNAHPAKVNWHREMGFDLVTVNDPVPGRWQLDTKEDPDNRVLVVTNLELEVSDVPNYILPNEKVGVRARLLQKNKPVKEQAIIERTRFYIQQFSGGKTRETTLLDHGKEPDESASDGWYSQWLKLSGESAVHDIAVVAEGPTFQRQYRHQVKFLAELIAVEIRQLEGQKEGEFLIDMKPAADTAGINIQKVEIVNADNRTPLGVLKPEQQHWQAHAGLDMAEKTFDLVVEGDFNGKRPFTIKQILNMPKDKTKPAEQQPPEPAKHDETADDEAAPSGSANWKAVTALVVMANGLIGLLAVIGWLFWQKKRRSNHAEGDVQQA